MLKHTDYSKRSGISDAYFCLLGLNRPRYLEEGDPIPLQVYSTRANRNDKHHIFPRDLLKRNGFAKRDYNSIGNICFIVAKENQSIGSKRPASGNGNHMILFPVVIISLIKGLVSSKSDLANE